MFTFILGSCASPPSLVPWVAPAETTDPGETTSIVTAVGWIAVAASADATCGVRAGGALACWGTPAVPAIASPPGGGYTAVALGPFHACGITQWGALACWGDNDFGQASPPDGSNWIDVAVGDRHTCARTTAGRVECWGDGSEGQGSLPDGRYAAIATGSAHTCALAEPDRDVVCVGADVAGEVSDTDALGSYVWALAAGPAATCGITSNDYGTTCVGDIPSLHANDQYWDNQDLAIGDGFVVVTTVRGPWTALHGSGAVPWGADPDTSGISWFDAMPEGAFPQITAGSDHLCVVDPIDEILVCLGDDTAGQLTPPD